jgi:hypothetical protein
MIGDQSAGRIRSGINKVKGVNYSFDSCVLHYHFDFLINQNGKYWGLFVCEFIK